MKRGDAGVNNQEVTIGHKRDIIDYVNSNPSSRKGILIVLVALGGVFVDAYDFASLAIGIDQITDQFGLSPFEVGSLTAIMAVGALLGAFFGGVITDKIGRNKMFTLTLILLVISAFGVALSFNLISLIIFRFLLGVGVGLDVPVALSFIAEVSNTKRKGQMVNLWQPMWYAAASFTGLVILPLYLFGAEENLWRYAVGFGGVAALIILLLRLKYMDESPMWAANNLSLEEASKVLEKTYDINVKVNKTSKPVENKEKESNKASLSMIFSKRYRARTFLASMIASTQSIEYFAVGFYIPTISVLIFGKGIIYGIIGTLLFNFFGIVGGLTQSFATSKLGIRKLAIIGYTIVCVCLLSLGLMGDDLPLILTTLLVGGFIFGHSFGPGSQGMSFATLSYPTSLRGIGSGWGQTMVRVGSIIGFLFFPIVLSLLGLHKTLLVLTIVPLLGLLCTLIIQWDPTTKDIENEDETENESAILQQRKTQNL